MRDPRISTLAQTIVNYSLEVNRSERVLIDIFGEGKPLGKELVKLLNQIGALPYVRMIDPEIQAEWIKGIQENDVKILQEVEQSQLSGIDKYIGIQGLTNDSDFSGIPQEQFRLFREVVKPSKEHLLTHKKWVELYYPTPSLAQKFGMSTDQFFDFYFDVLSIDYVQLAQKLKPLQELMNQTSQVRIVGPKTDVSFSIKGIGSVICSGKRNLPDGEIYTAPIKNSVNGIVTYNVPSQYAGFTFDDIQLTLKDGKIINATSNNTEKLNQLLDSDEGARYIGEFAIGVNPLILTPMRNIMFDEKIAGSFHLTPGQAYKAADNGNRSSIHWDLISIQRAEYGGGEIWFDEVLIRKDGLFVLPSLVDLNP
ncbi:aminopeptidase [Brevibacillus ginsengisoli]|uniref:aminopeptidase n=1 Tax=Brevibacillus ginsengisoli TaxID=363854 RepID=UPI003CF27039